MFELKWRGVICIVALAVVVASCAAGTDIYSPGSSSSDGRLIRLHIGACHAELTAHVDERADRVMVRVGARHGYDGDCGGQIDIHLSAPLGDRPLIDASDGDEIEVQPDPSLDGSVGSGPVGNGASVIEALETRGFGVLATNGESEWSPFGMAHDPFSHTVTNLDVESRHMVIYEFPNTETADQAAAVVSPDGYGVAGGQYEWIDTPRFWHSGRVIVLYLGDDLRFVEELTSILGSSFAGG